jgi:hypothetical protein
VSRDKSPSGTLRSHSPCLLRSSVFWPSAKRTKRRPSQFTLHQVERSACHDGLRKLFQVKPNFNKPQWTST